MMMTLLWLTVHIVMLVVVLNVPISGLATINPPKCCFRIGWGSAVTRGQLAVATCIPEVNDWSRSRHVVPGPATLKLGN